MAGRILTFQDHPEEGQTNYAGQVAMRCNLDVQDLRRVLPPKLWMPEADLEPDGKEEDGSSYNHGAYPHRFRELSLGAQEDWGWFQHLGTTPESDKLEVVAVTGWHAVFSELAASSPAEHSEAVAALKDASSRAALAAFVDAHNAGYYINAYTTKLNPTMDDVLQRLLEGVRRLTEEWQDRETEPAAAAKGTTSASSEVPAAAVDQRRNVFRSTMQVLNQI